MSPQPATPSHPQPAPPPRFWPPLPSSHPLIALHRKLPEIIGASDGYTEIWGVQLKAPASGIVATRYSTPAPSPPGSSKGSRRRKGNGGVKNGGEKQGEEANAPIENTEETTDETEKETAKQPDTNGTPNESKAKDFTSPTNLTTSPESESEESELIDFATGLILQKFLRANHNDVARAFLQLQDTMKWRRSFFGPGGEIEKGWDEEKFKGLGYTSVIPSFNSSSGSTAADDAPTNPSNDRPIVISWNIYGATKDIRHTFTPLHEFLRWRVALMETTLSSLSLATAVHPIPDHTFGTDPYQCLQIHDYLSVSFLRLPKEVREASKQTIELFGRYYPETLEKKVMVNVPAVMGWVFGLVKRVVARETVSKMVVLGRGKELSGVLGIGGVPGRYGGMGEELEVMGTVPKSPRKKAGEESEEREAEEKAVNPLQLTSDPFPQSAAEPATPASAPSSKPPTPANNEPKSDVEPASIPVSSGPHSQAEPAAESTTTEPRLSHGEKTDEKTDDQKDAEAVLIATPAAPTAVEQRSIKSVRISDPKDAA